MTVSIFGNIIKRKKADVSKLVNRLSTTCDSLSHLKAIRFGKENEDVASQLYVQNQNSHGSPGTKVFHGGLVINPHFPWLGASPGRLVYDSNAEPSTGGLEVKCNETAQGMSPLEALNSKQTPKEGKKDIVLPKNERWPSAAERKSQLLLPGPGSRRSIRNRMV